MGDFDLWMKLIIVMMTVRTMMRVATNVMMKWTDSKVWVTIKMATTAAAAAAEEMKTAE